MRIRGQRSTVRASNAPSRFLCGVSAAAIALGVAATPAAAADRYWDPNQTAAGRGGNGTWNTSTNLWSPNNDGTSGPYVSPWDNAALDNAIFGDVQTGTGFVGTINLGSPITVHNMTFEEDVTGTIVPTNYIFNGGTLTLGGVNPTITANGNDTGTNIDSVTINSAIAGNAGLAKTGGGILNLNGVNTFSGGISVSGGGTLALNGDTALGDAANGITIVAVNTADTSLENRLVSSGALAASRVVTLSGTGRVFISGGGVGLARFTGTGGLDLDADVVLTNNLSDYTGQTRLIGRQFGGTFNISSIADLGVASAIGAPTTVANGTIVVQAGGNGDSTFNYTGGTASSNRNWELRQNFFGWGAIANNGTGTLTLTGDIAASTGNARFTALTADLRIDGVISGGNPNPDANRPMYFTGSGTGRNIILNGANTFTGRVVVGIQGASAPVTVVVNTLADTGAASSLGMGTNVGTLPAVNLVNSALSYTGTGSSSNRTWGINGASTIRSDGSGALALSGSVTFEAGGSVENFTLGGSFAGVNTLSGVISGAGNLIMNGSGSWLISGANTFTGGVTVQNGTLQAGNTQAFGLANPLTVNGGTLDLNGFDTAFASLTGTGGSIALIGADLIVNGTASPAAYIGGLTGDGGLTKGGTGTLTLAGQSTYTGDTTVGGGTLALNFAAASAPTDNIISNLSTLNMTGGTLTITGAAGEANSQTFDGLNVTAGNNRITAVSGAGGSMTVNLGALSNTGGLMDFALPASGSFTTSNPDGTLSWATVNGSTYAQVAGNVITPFTAFVNKDNASTWLSGEFISDAGGAANTPFTNTVAGNVQLGGLQYTAAANSTVTVNGTLGVDGTIIVSSSTGSTNQAFNGSGSLTGRVGGGTLGVLHNGTGTFTIGTTIVDNGGAIGFTKAGTGQVTLNNSNNSYTGATTLSGGTLFVGSIGNGGTNSAIGASTADSSNLVIESGTLRYGGVTATTDRGFTLINGGPSRTIQIDDGSANLTFTGLVTSPDDAGLTKTGAGTLTLANDTNDYVGVTTVSAGTLSVDTLANGGVVSGIGRASAASQNLVLQTGGTLQYTGATTSIDRGFTLVSGAGGVDVSNATTTLTVSGTAVGAGSLTKSGGGTLVLTGTNSYSGGTTVADGTLRAGSAQAFGSIVGNMTVNAGATLDLANFTTSVGGLLGAGDVTLGSATLVTRGTGTFSGEISGTGVLNVVSGGQTLSGCNSSYTGATVVGGGHLATDCLANGGQASGIGASGSAASNFVIGNATFSYTGSSVTTDRGFTASGGSGASTNFNVTDAAATLEFTGLFTGSGLFIKSGAGTLMLSNGANNYNGIVSIAGGTVRAGADGTPFGRGMVQMANTPGATLDVNNRNVTIGALAGGGGSGGNVTLGSGTLTINQGNSSTYGGAISGTGNLVKAGGGGQTLSGCNSSYSGTTTISGGVLAVDCLANGGANSSIGSSSNSAANLILSGGTLQYVGAGSSTDRLFTLGPSASSALDASGTGAIVFTNTGAIAFSTPNTSQTVTLTGLSTANNSLGAQITNNGTGVTSLSKTGSGTWILTNPGSTYTGVTTISGGVLGVDKLADGGVASSIGASSAAAANLVIGNGSTLRYTGAGDTTNRLFTLAAGTTFIESSGTGAIVFTDTGPVTLQTNNQARTIALGGTNTGDNTLAGSIGDAGTGVTTLAKNDGGKWVLTGNNTYTGNTNINAGTLVIGAGGTTGSISSLTVNNFGTLGFNRSDATTYGGLIQGTGSLQQLGTGTTILTGTNTYTGGTAIAQGTLQLGNGGTTGSIVGNVTNNGTLAFNRSNTYQFDGLISGTGQVTQIGTGTTMLTADNSYSGGTTITSGTLQVGNGGTTGSVGTGNVVNNAALVFNRSNDLTFAGLISGSGTLTKLGGGILTLLGNNSYTGGTTITSGTLQIGNGGTSGSIVGDIVNNAALIFNRSDAVTYGDDISGSGSLTQSGAGTLTLTGTNSYSGATNVNAGTLLINGINSGSGLTSVASGATLGGIGTVGGDVTIADGGTLTAGSNGAGTFNILGDLALGSGSAVNLEFGAANSVGNPLNDLINVGGDLTLDGTLNVSVTSGGSFGAGIYRVINYSGTLTNNGLTVGTMPMGSEVFVQTAVANQVNLVNTANLTLNFWDGDAGPKFDSLINGGNGIWQNSSGNDNWTDSTGVVNAPYTDAAIAIFTAAPGTVTVDNSLGAVTTAGMQFASDGYVLTGDDLTLVGATAEIRVGDASAAGAGYVATINNELTGSSQLVKTDLGTLVLNGSNSYTGGTAINGGTLRISSDANLGDAAGALSINGGTLHTTANVTSNRTVSLAGNGTFLTDSGTTLALNNIVSGVGALTKTGAGTLVLAADNSYSGGTTISAGTLQLGNGGTTGGIVGNVTNNGTLAFNRSDTFTFGGVISGSGSINQMGPGTTILTAANSYTGGTTISGGILQIGNGGTTGSILGNVVNNGTLTFNRSDNVTFAGVISGSGGVEQDGSGTLTLTGTSTYAGDTNVNAGTLLVNGDLSGALGATNVVAGATLGGTGIIGGDANVNGTLAAGSNGIGELTINGALALGAGSTLEMEFGQANTPGGPLNDLIEVGGDLDLDGTINVTVTAGGSFDVGLYRVINYGGTLTDNGLALGTMPADSSVVVQTSIAGQVNLVNASDLTLNIWDGAAGPKNDGAVNGGDGTWHLGGADNNWTNVAGSINAPYADASFAIFSAAAGTVTVDNSGGPVTTAGMQFASDGYVIDGDALTLVGPQSIIRVGDGTLAGGLFDAMIVAELTGTSELVKTDLGTLILTGTNRYTGGTTVAEGTLQIGNGGTSGSIVGNVTNNGALAFNRSDEVTFGGIISGSGTVSQNGTGTLTLTGANSYTGATNVNVGTLLVNGNQSGATGLTSVASGATLGGIGTIGGNVAIGDGALTPGSNGVGTLTINGNLAFGAGSTLNMEFGQANTVGGSLNDLVNVGGDLMLDGTLNVSVPAGGTFGPGIYRVINYAGTLTDNGLSLGIMPAGSDATVQTSVAGQVNLLNTGGLTLNFWDGAAGPKFDGAVNGGNGVWQNSAGNNNWTDESGAVNAAFADGTFAIFSATAGTVTVDNSLGAITASGMQFASDGYVITGEELTLVGPQATIRVGDGTVAGAGFDATISAELTGASQLVKTDAGTLILTGANTYAGGTAINGGTLQISSDANLGDAAGDLSFDGGTLATTASLTSGRDMAIVGAGTIATSADTVFTANGLLSGTGALAKSGTGTLLLTANSAGYTGPINIAAGILAVQGTVGSQVTVGAAGRLEGTGHVASAINNGVIAPGMGGFGTLTIDGNYTGGGSLEIETGLGDDASQTDRLVVGGDTSGATEVTVINRNGLGAQTVEGIKIIDVGGASNGTFTLNGDYLYEGQEAMVAGAFAYTLQKNGVSTPTDGDWYLRSSLIDQPETPLYQPGVPVYEAYSDALMKLNDMPTWRQRIGTRQWASDTARNMGLWGRVEVTRHRAEAEASTSLTDAETDLLSLQAGIDRIVHEDDRGALVAGLTAQYREADTRVSSVFGDGDIDIKGKGIGGTLSWYGANGFYADAQAQLSWYDADLESDVLGDLTRGNDGNGQAFSIELGQQIGSGRLTITPQAQLVYSVIGFDRFTDPNDASVSIDKDASLRARFGISLDRRFLVDGKVRGGVYGIANLSYELLDGTRTDVSGTGLSRRDDRLWGEAGVGGNYRWGNVSLYGEASATTALGNFGDSYGMKAQAGIRVGF